MSFLTDKSILLISSEPWEHLLVSKHHYAIKLAEKGNRVFFLGPPGSTYNISNSGYEELKILGYKGFIKGLSFYPGFLRRSIQKNMYKKLQALSNVTFDIIWSFDNSVFYDLNFASDKVLKILHIVDLNMDFQLARAAKTSDICFASTKYILDKLKNHNSKSFMINHGLSVSDKPEEFELPQVSGLKAGYAGNLSIPYLDLELLNEIIDGNKEINFFLAGKANNEINGSKKNLHYVGALSKPELDWFLDQMDLLLIIYKAEEYKEQLANPHKMLEYLYSGKPIVSTYTAEYENSELVFMSRSRDEFLVLFDKVVGDNLLLFDEAMAKKRREYALDNTYEKQLARIESYLTE